MKNNNVYAVNKNFARLLNSLTPQSYIFQRIHTKYFEDKFQASTFEV